MAQQFIASSTVTYDISSDGNTVITHDITLQNNTSDFYATSYTLSLTGTNPISPNVIYNNQILPVKITKTDNQTNIGIDFPDDVVGIGSKRQFNISFQDKSLVTKNGEIWEITTPKLADSNSFDNYSTVIKVPSSFGNLAYISPNPVFKDNQSGKMVYQFNKEASTKNVITAAFGNFQVFSFDINYHLENSSNGNILMDIDLPADTSYQKMNYTNISPKPVKVVSDADGNWIATFALRPNQKINVKATGAVQIFASPQVNPKTDYKDVISNLGATDLWQVNDPKIQALARQLKTPEAIYNYVVSTLSYDYSRVTPDTQRLGAVWALNNPKNAICTEFTDLFVAIARGAHIPAREVEGFAYTDNPQIQPLSLVADVLHAWPEYWDEKSQAWIPVDPTWGSTSGIDYFNKLDLKHFSFVVHGTNSRLPYSPGSYKVGTNPQKDVNVTFGSLPQNRVSNLQINENILSELPFGDEIINVKINNPGPIALYGQDLKIVFDNIFIDKDIKIDSILPYGYFETNVSVPYSFLGQKTPAKVELLVNDVRKSEFSTYKTYVTISNLLLFCLFIFFVVFVIYLKFRDVKTKKYTN